MHSVLPILSESSMTLSDANHAIFALASGRVKKAQDPTTEDQAI